MMALVRVPCSLAGCVAPQMRMTLSTDAIILFSSDGSGEPDFSIIYTYLFLPSITGGFFHACLLSEVVEPNDFTSSSLARSAYMAVMSSTVARSLSSRER